MSDIFISYMHEERPQARRLADALETEGWTVWWDPKLHAGEHFDDVIERALEEASCVIVLWSPLSVKSRFVKDEASYALEHGKLIPVIIEETALPFRFRNMHYRRLHDWAGQSGHPEFRALIEDLRARIAKPAAPSGPSRNYRSLLDSLQPPSGNLSTPFNKRTNVYRQWALIWDI